MVMQWLALLLRLINLTSPACGFLMLELTDGILTYQIHHDSFFKSSFKVHVLHDQSRNNTCLVIGLILFLYFI